MFLNMKDIVELKLATCNNSFKMYGHENFVDESSSSLNIDQFLRLLNIGDIIFSRSFSPEGNIIQFSGHCIWNHIALVYVSPETNEKYWWECTNGIDEDNMPESCKP